MALEDIKKDRLKKLNNLKNAGVDPYPASSNRQQMIAQALEMMDQKVVVAGRIRSLRPHGKIAFADLEDESGRMQLLFTQENLANFDLITNFDIGDFIEALGIVIKTQAGQITVAVESFKLLTKSMLPLPSEWHGLEDVEERYRQRYVDLIINPEVRKVFEIRHRVIRLLRDFMNDKGFVEVETPTLQPLYGGATAKPFMTHHNALDVDLYLRISDELYLKRLVVAGFEKVFEICKDFRNEGIDRQHNPEFTMMEFYWAYANYEDLMKMTEEMVSQVVKEIHDGYKFEFEGQEVDFAPPYPRIKFKDLVKEQCGIDLDVVDTEEKLLQAIKDKGIKLDLSGVVGFGPLSDELYKKVARPNIKNPTFVIDYPYEMKPLAKKTDDQKSSASFQLLCLGYELVNAYNELNDPQEQRARWEEEEGLAKKGLEEHQEVDEDYLRALEYGMPPTAGWGMGIDRFVSLLTNQHTLKDVILFPTLKPESAANKIKQDFKKKMVVVVRPDLEPWQVTNAIAHAAAFLGNKMSDPFDTGDSFVTSDDVTHPRNSQYPIIVLSGKKGELPSLVKDLRKSELLYIDFIREMIETSDDDKLEGQISSKKDDELEILGVGIFGPKDKVEEVTKQFELYK